MIFIDKQEEEFIALMKNNVIKDKLEKQLDELFDFYCDRLYEEVLAFKKYGESYKADSYKSEYPIDRFDLVHKIDYESYKTARFMAIADAILEQYD